MTYTHDCGDVEKDKPLNCECKLCGQANINPAEEAFCPEKIIQEAVRRIKEETTP